jgi:hypothetical protein
MDALCSYTWQHDAKTRKTPTAYYKRASYSFTKDNLRMDTPRRAQVIGDAELSGSRTFWNQWPRERGNRLYCAWGYTLLGERTSEAHLQGAAPARMSGQDNGADGAPYFRWLACQRGPKCQRPASYVRLSFADKTHSASAIHQLHAVNPPREVAKQRAIFIIINSPAEDENSPHVSICRKVRIHTR